jgi:hypothetical protein
MQEETLKSPENSEKEKPKYVSRCLVCGHRHDWGFADAHTFPYLPVSDEEENFWRACGDSEQAIMSRIAARGKAE